MDYTNEQWALVSSGTWNLACYSLDTCSFKLTRPWEFSTIIDNFRISAKFQLPHELSMMEGRGIHVTAETHYLNEEQNKSFHLTETDDENKY